MPIFGHNVFSELVLLLLIAMIAGAVFIRLKQPLVIGFIAVGILAGPSALNLVQSTDQIHLFAEMGLALLLFVVGLKLDVLLLRALGVKALLAGLGQVVLTTAIGFLLGIALHMPPLAALYVAVALTLSSTIIIVKLLSDKHETESLHGRLTLGILIVQDLAVVLAMLALTAFGGDTPQPPALQALYIGLHGIGLVGGVALVTLFILPRVMPLLAQSAELLVLFGIAWALILAQAADLLGFGKEIGAFLAGVSLASTPYREIISAKLVSLRDFLLLFFFIELGSRLELGGLGAQVAASSVFALFVLIGKPLLAMVVMGLMGYRRRTGFMTGLSLAQVSEFSLIFIAMGAQLGHVGGGTVGMVTLVGLITIGVSSFLIQHAQGLYARLSPLLRVFERRNIQEAEAGSGLLHGEGADVILIGIGEYGTGIAGHLMAHDRTVLGVDFDPQAVSAWQGRGWRAAFGDAEDPDFAATLPLQTARWVVSAVRDPQSNVALAKAVRHAGYTGNIAFTARSRGDGEHLVAEHGGLLFVPFEDAAMEAVDLLLQREDEIARETMDRLIEKTSDHYIVCGYGRMGQQIARDFRRQGVPFVVIEDNPEQLPRLREEGVLHIVGEATTDAILLRAGIQRAKGLIAVAATDEENVFIVLTARGLNQRLFIVARSIREENEDKLRRAGADRVMSPYILGGRRMAAAVTRPTVMDFLDLVIHSDDMATEIGHINIPEGGSTAERSVQDLGLWQSCGVTLLAVRRNSELHANPSPGFVLKAGDELIVMGTTAQIEAAQSQLSGRVAI